VATTDKSRDVVELGVQGLRDLGWPEADEDWAQLAALGRGSLSVLHVLLSDQDAAVRARAAEALGQVGGAHGESRSYAVVRLAHQARVDRNSAVRHAVCQGLLGLGFPNGDAEWSQIDKMGAGALCFLTHLVRGEDADRRAKALAKGRDLCPGTLAMAEREVDHSAILYGLELQWDIDFARRRDEVLALMGKGQLEHASALFGEALTECEATEKRIHTLIVETGIWPGCGVANKWGELASLLMDRRLARLRDSWPLTIGNWKTTLHKRSQDADLWRAAYQRAERAADRAARLAALDEFMKQHPQSFYTQFAWKWRDTLGSTAARRP
jgi:hypothetical protein